MKLCIVSAEESTKSLPSAIMLEFPDVRTLGMDADGQLLAGNTVCDSVPILY